MATRSVNKAILIGNLGQDPEVRYSTSGAAICNVSIATTESWKDRESGERQEKTEWHRLVFFGRLAEIVGEYLTKGSSVYVEGRIQTRKWQDQASGQDRYTTEIVVSDMRMLGGKGGGSYTQYDDSKSDAPPSQQDQGDSKKSGSAASAASDAPAKPTDFDDEIPF